MGIAKGSLSGSPVKAAIGNTDAIGEGAGVFTQLLRPPLQVTLHHHGMNGLIPRSNLLDDLR